VFAATQLDRMEEIMGAVHADFDCKPIEFKFEVNQLPSTVASSRLV
jgi:hypothetical protein